MNLDNREEPIERYCAGCDRRDDDIAVLETALAEANRDIGTGIADLKFTERQLEEKNQRIAELENHITRLEKRMKNFENRDLVIHQANQMAVFADGYNMFREVLKNWLFSKDADENIVVSKKAVQELIGEDEIKPISGDDSICSKCHRYGREKNEVLKQRITELVAEIKKLKEE